MCANARQPLYNIPRWKEGRTLPRLGEGPFADPAGTFFSYSGADGAASLAGVDPGDPARPFARLSLCRRLGPAGNPEWRSHSAERDNFAFVDCAPLWSDVDLQPALENGERVPPEIVLTFKFQP